MTSTSRCPRCYTPLRPTESPGGLCPKCLISVAMGEPAVHRSVTGAPLPPPPTAEELAEHFPQLVIGEVIGRGGMGVVYGAVQRDLDRMVALKVLTVDHESDPTFSERFQREARAMASLSHPNIAAVYDSGRAGPWYYLILELVDGPNLRQVISDGDISASNALRIVGEMCIALDFAHSEGVVHRDIKPENVLLDPKGRVKIVDFGLAKLVTPGLGHPTLTRTDQAMGTLHYVAPEQVRRPLEVDHRADIYSMGVVFYELLTGELPMGRFEVPSKLRATDPRMDPVVLKTLENDPERRYQHASDVQLDVDHIRNSPRASGKSGKERSHAPKPRRERRGWHGVAMGCLGVLVLGMVAFVALLVLAQPQPAETTLSDTGIVPVGTHPGTGVSVPGGTGPLTESPGETGSISFEQGNRMIGAGASSETARLASEFDGLAGPDRLALAVGRWPLPEDGLREELELAWLSYRAAELVAAEVSCIPWNKDMLRVDIAPFQAELELICDQVLDDCGVTGSESCREIRAKLLSENVFPSGLHQRILIVDDTSPEHWVVHDDSGPDPTRWVAGTTPEPELGVLEALLTTSGRRAVRQRPPRWTIPFASLGLDDVFCPMEIWEAGQRAWDEYRRVEMAHTRTSLQVGEDAGEVVKTLDLQIDSFSTEVTRIVTDLEAAIRAELPANQAEPMIRGLNLDVLCPFGLQPMHFVLTQTGRTYRVRDLIREEHFARSGMPDPEVEAPRDSLSSAIAHWNAYFVETDPEDGRTTNLRKHAPRSTVDGAESMAILIHKWPIEDPQAQEALAGVWERYRNAQVDAARLDPDHGNTEWLRVEVDAFPDELDAIRADLLQAAGPLTEYQAQALEERLRDPKVMLWGNQPHTFWVRRLGVTWEAMGHRFGRLTYTPGLATDTRIAMLDGWLTSDRIEAAQRKAPRWSVPFEQCGVSTRLMPSDLLDLMQRLWDDYRELERMHSEVTVRERTAEEREASPDVRHVRLRIAAFAEERAALLQEFTLQLDAMTEDRMRDQILQGLKVGLMCPYGEQEVGFELIVSPSEIQVGRHDLAAPEGPDGPRLDSEGMVSGMNLVGSMHWFEYAGLPKPK